MASSLTNQLNSIHATTERERIPCTYVGCGKKFLGKDTLAKHFKREHDENPIRFPCTLCEKVFKRKYHLEVHIATDTAEKAYKCVTCGRSFSRLGDLQKHGVRMRFF